MADVFEDVCNIVERCWRGALSVEVNVELEWLCTIHLVNCYGENMLNIVNMYVRDHVVVTGDNHLILIAVGHPRVPGVCQLHKNCH